MLNSKSKLVKTKREIEIMKISGKICARTLNKILENVRAGVSTIFLNQIAEEEIKRNGAIPSFSTVEGYHWAICATTNDGVVHGIPDEDVLKEGDIIGIDLGVLYQGFHSDMSITVPVGKVDKATEKFLEVGKKTLNQAVRQAQVGNRIGDISAVIQEGIEKAGYSIVKNLTGHGIGRALHEEPLIPGFGKAQTGPKILENMTLAIEVIYAQGSGEVKSKSDHWTISTIDGSLGGLFEQTIYVSPSGPIVLTPYI